jgi:hypothetical protein
MTSAALASPLPGRSLSDIPFDSTAGVQMRYRSTSPFTEQDEIVMFSRDTEEMYQSVTTTLVQYAQSNSLAYQVQILPNTLPSAATYSYPPSSGFPSFTFVGEMLTTPAFFGTFAPAGAAAEPDGSGSIKAVRVVQHGRCSHEYKYVNPAPTPTEPSVLDTFIDRFVTALNDNVHQVVSSSTVNFSFREQLGFQHETEDREDSQWGGFWWFAKASPSDGGLIRFNVPYFPYLLDGRVSLLPTVSALFLSGTNAAITSPILGSLEGGQLQLVDRAYERIQTPLRSSQVANQLFDDLQADTVTPAPTTCTMRIAGTGQRSRTIVGPALPGPDQCGTWLSTTVIPQFTASISTVTPPLTAAERTRALENFRLATETADIDGAFAKWSHERSASTRIQTGSNSSTSTTSMRSRQTRTGFGSFAAATPTTREDRPTRCALVARMAAACSTRVPTPARHGVRLEVARHRYHGSVGVGDGLRRPYVARFRQRIGRRGVERRTWR